MAAADLTPIMSRTISSKNRADKSRSCGETGTTVTPLQASLDPSEKTAREQLKALNLLFSRWPEEKNISGLFNGWCKQTAEKLYPGIGTKAYAVPPYFHAKQCVKPYSGNSNLTSRSRLSSGSTGSASSDVASLSVEITEPRILRSDSRTDAAILRRSSKDLAKCGTCFLENTAQDSARRGDIGHCNVGRVFRILNAIQEKEKKKTMFIMSGLHYDNVLSLIRRKRQGRYLSQHFQVNDFKNITEREKSTYLHEDVIKNLEKRGELDLFVLHEDKGAILIQIKAITKEFTEDADNEKDQPSSSPKKQNPIPKIESKIKEACGQLENDARNLNLLMSMSKNWSDDLIHKVVALPNLQWDDLEEIPKEKGILFLCKDDMPPEDPDSIQRSEIETDISLFRNWWEQLPSKREKLDPKYMAELMADIVGKYIGPLSVVMESKDGNATEQLRFPRDCIKYTQRLTQRLILTQEQKEILEEKTKGQKRVYISGAPGSGKTLLLTRKADAFLEEAENHLVIIVNMYRGEKGRSIGQRLYEVLSQKHREKVLHVQTDVSGRPFLEDLESAAENPPHKVSKSKQTGGQTSQSFHTGNAENFLFVVDEIYVESFWEEVLKDICGKFVQSTVWCAGLFSQNPSGFEEHGLDVVIRCPPSVQNLLYHVDWDEGRKKSYSREMSCPEHSTIGPTPLCIRHERHGDPLKPVLDCASCAQELAELLKGENYIWFLPKSGENKAQSYSQGSGATNTEEVTTSQEMTIVILFNLPRDKYSPTENYIETTSKAYNEYAEYVQSSVFMETLKKQSILVKVRTKLAHPELHREQTGSDVMATWLYNFQGLEAGVVIYLPGDLSPTGGDQTSPGSDIPTPGLKTVKTDRPLSTTTSADEDSSKSAGAAAASPKPTRESEKRATGAIEKRTTGASEKRATGTSEKRATGAIEKRTTGISEKRATGTSEKRTTGTSEKRATGTSEKRATGAIGKRTTGASEKRTTGAKHDTPEADDEVQTRGKKGRKSESGGEDQSASYNLSDMCWMSADIERFSRWDKNNLFIAASRSLGLVIFFTP